MGTHQGASNSAPSGRGDQDGDGTGKALQSSRPPELKGTDAVARWAREEMTLQVKAQKYEYNPGEI